MSNPSKFLILEIPKENDKLGSPQKLIFPGEAIGDDSNTSAEVVFQTGMVGYPESLTDPSYQNQILVLTYPIIGSYGIPSSLERLESDRIHVAGVVVGESVDRPSHHWEREKKKIDNFDDWLKQHRVPGIQGVDTRKLTKIIREHGTLTGYLVNQVEDVKQTPTLTSLNLVSLATQHQPQIKKYYRKQLTNDQSKEINVLVINCGIKRSQLTLLRRKADRVCMVKWDYDFLSLLKTGKFNRLFISNGPGDPKDCTILIERLKEVMNCPDFLDLPIFGICLGHQILALAAGATSYKMKYGNRGHNIPCQLVGTKRCIITSQNHGYAIDTSHLDKHQWIDLFVNANDGSNEGIRHASRPYYSVQFHPEASAGPEDSMFMMDLFLKNQLHTLYQVMNPDNLTSLPKPDKKKLLIIGSGGLCIGQSGEFDYSGSQSIKAYKEEGLQIILVNPNVATIQTSPGFADKVYYLPVQPEYILKVIKLEKPDCVTLSFGGQSALNCGVELYRQGVFNKYGIQILGSNIESVILTEDRERFKNYLHSIGEETIPSYTARTKEEAYRVLQNLEFPVLVRASYALGGLGSGFANNEQEFEEIVTKAFAYSSQVIIDKSLRGWKEVEYEVVRDAYDNCICVCNMENLDPLGVHTGESIVVAPSQTLNDQEYQMLRTTALKTIRGLGIVGECNIQYALDPQSEKYYIVEVNARLSRSSALASKATGYPLAYVAAKLSLNYSLTDLRNSLTQNTTACFEPSLDYLVVKVPRWDLDKFPKACRVLDSSMKSVGEAMGIGRTFEEAFQKALRMANEGCQGFTPNYVSYQESHLTLPTYQRVFALATAIYQKVDLEEIYRNTKIDYWFLYKMAKIVEYQKYLESPTITSQNLSYDMIYLAKRLGFSDKQIANFTESTELVIRKRREEFLIGPSVKRIDTVAAEFPCDTNYLYTTYSTPFRLHDVEYPATTRAVMVLGSGVYRIGSSVEFDWCAVNCLHELRRQGERTIMINCNPETVSTDYDEADTLYFEEISFETVMDIYQLETPKGVVLSVGGQLPNNIAMSLHRQKVLVLGTNPTEIDTAENRYKFSRLLETIGVDQPRWKELISIQDAKQFCQEQTYPCLVRPSYVLSGQAMNVAYNDEDLETYLKSATRISKDYPIVISKFIEDAKEIEVDAVAQDGTLLAIAISEHLENAGVHSGDATLIFPPRDLTEITTERIKEATLKIARGLHINGPFNIQFIAKDNQLKVIECNLRVSRTFPFVSKTMNLNLIRVATQVMLKNLTMEIPDKIKTKRVGVKVPMFSFSRLKGADVSLGVEMVSTGEVACFGETAEEAYLKGIIASDVKLPPPKGKVLLSIGSFAKKKEFLGSVTLLQAMGYQLFGTSGTYDYYQDQGIKIRVLSCSQILEALKSNDGIDLVVNISNTINLRFANYHMMNTNGYRIRRAAIDNQVPLITNVKNGKLYIRALHRFYQQEYKVWCNPATDCFTTYQTVRLPGLIDTHVHLREPGQPYKEDWETCTRAALAGGITMIGVMPNTSPSITDHETQRMILNLAETKAHCDYGVYLGATLDNAVLWKDPKLTDASMALKMYLNNTFGPLLLDDTQVWMDHLRSWPTNRPICVHAERQTLASLLFLAKMTQRAIHVCHVATQEEIGLIRMAKESGMPVTCEVAPHHLFLTDMLEQTTSPALCTVKPPLAGKSDQQALWDNLDIVDCFATDHAPHTKDDKEKHHCPGFPGLETALPLLLTAVSQGRLTLEDIVLRYHTNPKRIFGLPDQPDTYLEVDLEQEWEIPERLKYTKCGWTPFTGMKVKGMIRRVVLRGKTVYVDGEVLAKPGFGKNIRTISVESAESRAITPELRASGKVVELHVQKVLEEIRSTAAMARTIPDKLVNLLSVEQLNRNLLRRLFSRADEMTKMVKERGVLDILSGKVLGSVFYEPSTRTRCSFTVAMQRMGGQVVEVGADGSSVKKGETLSDFVKTMECYTDALVVRTPSPNLAKELPRDLSIPVINAGDGVGEHPTQALLDIYTMRKEKGTVTGKTVALVGDLRHGRTTHSLAKLLTLYQNVRLIYVSPENLRMPEEVKRYVAKRGLEQVETDDLLGYLPIVDILYMTRMQKERGGEGKYYCLDSSSLRHAKEDLVIMHPLPRVNEISPEIDDDPRSAYFRQMENGLYVRMALLEHLLVK